MKRKLLSINLCGKEFGHISHLLYHLIHITTPWCRYEKTKSQREGLGLELLSRVQGAFCPTREASQVHLTGPLLLISLAAGSIVTLGSIKKKYLTNSFRHKYLCHNVFNILGTGKIQKKKQITFPAVRNFHSRGEPWIKPWYLPWVWEGREWPSHLQVMNCGPSISLYE